MPRISIKTLLIFVALVSMFLAPIGVMLNHSRTWAPAEKTEDMLSDLYRDAAELADFRNVSLGEINELLKRPEYMFLNQNRDDTIELRGSELVWFSPNNTYSIGLCRNGTKPWIHNKKRN